MIEFIKLFTPPILVNLVRGLRDRLHRQAKKRAVARRGPPQWEYIPEGWSFAGAHPEVKGWNVRSVLEAYQSKWPQFVDLTQRTTPLQATPESTQVVDGDINSQNTLLGFAYALILSARKMDKLSMLDWGGSIGHYYLISKSILPDVDIEYHCKDVSILTEYGAKLFPDQHFYSDETCLRRSYDFVFASSSMHYTEAWKALFARLAGATRGYLYITRLPTVLDAPSYVFVQRPTRYGYDTEYLSWCLNRDEFLLEAKMHGLTLVREFVIGERPSIVNAPGQCQYRGFLFRSASQA